MNKAFCVYSSIMPSRPAQPASLHGRWTKNVAESDLPSFGRAMDAMKLSKMQKSAALHIVNGIKVNVVDKDTVNIEYLTKMPIPFKLKEQYKQGHTTSMSRRDMRKGQQTAMLKMLEDDEMQVEIAWDGQLPGRVYEQFRVCNNKLEIVASMEIEGSVYNIRQVYTKQL